MLLSLSCIMSLKSEFSWEHDKVGRKAVAKESASLSLKTTTTTTPVQMATSEGSEQLIFLRCQVLKQSLASKNADWYIEVQANLTTFLVGSVAWLYEQNLV